MTLMWKAWKVYLRSHQFLMNDIIQIQLYKEMRMYMAFLPYGHYFLFYISRQNFFIKHMLTTSRRDPSKKKKKDKKHTPNLKPSETMRGEKIFPITYFHKTHYPDPSLQNFKCTLYNPHTHRWQIPGMFLSIPIENQEPITILRLWGYMASFKDATPQLIYSK